MSASRQNWKAILGLADSIRQMGGSGPTLDNVERLARNGLGEPSCHVCGGFDEGLSGVGGINGGDLGRDHLGRHVHRRCVSQRQSEGSEP